MRKPSPADILHCFLSHRTKNTLDAYTRDLAKFAQYRNTGTDEALSDLLHTDHASANIIVLGWLNAMEDEGLAPSTRARRLVTLKSFVKLARTMGVVDYVIEIEGPAVPRRAALDTCDDNDYVIEIKGPAALDTCDDNMEGHLRTKVRPRPKKRHKKKYRIRGKTYTVREVEAEFGIPAKRFAERVRKGMTPEQAITNKNLKGKTGAKRYKIHGKTYTALEVEEVFGVPAKRFADRVRKSGMTPEEAVTTENLKGKTRAKRYQIHGKTYTPLEVEEVFGVPMKRFYDRIRKSGMTPEQAITNESLVGRTRTKRYEIHGKTYTALEVEAEFGVPAKCFADRVRKGRTPEEAVETPTRISKKRPTIDVAGVELSLRELGRLFGINDSTLANRVFRRRESLWDALKATVECPRCGARLRRNGLARHEVACRRG